MWMLMLSKGKMPGDIVGSNNSVKAPAPWVKTLLSIYPGLAAVLLAFYKDSIVRITKSAVHIAGINESLKTTLVILYWIALVVWLTIYFRTLFREYKASLNSTAQNKKLLDEIK